MASSLTVRLRRLPYLVVGWALLAGLSAEEMGLLAAQVQGPQHMLPHLWRRPQWLAWACYFVLAGLALRTRKDLTAMSVSDPESAQRCATQMRAVLA